MKKTDDENNSGAPFAPAEGSLPVEIPNKVTKGQTLYCMGYRCVVAGFMPPCFVLLRGKWGFDFESENAIPASRADFISYGVRLPRPGEIEAENEKAQRLPTEGDSERKTKEQI